MDGVGSDQVGSGRDVQIGSDRIGSGRVGSDWVSGRVGMDRIVLEIGDRRLESGDRRREIGDQFGLDCVGSVRSDRIGQIGSGIGIRVGIGVMSFWVGFHMV